jgi:MORN repeat variant
MKNLFWLFFAISFLLFACDQKKDNKNDLICQKTHWEDGSIKAEGCFTNDSIKEGLYKRYFRGGQLEYEINYHNNKEDGLWVNYYKNGKKHFILNYKNGLRSGSGLEYYENEAIKEYRVYNLKGGSGFEIDYLEDGSIKYIGGTPITWQSVNKDTLNIGDVLKIEFTVATPKNSEVTFQFYEDVATKRNAQYLQVSKKEGYGTVMYEKVLDKKGRMNWGATYLIRFDNRKEKDIKFKFIGFSTVR